MLHNNTEATLLRKESKIKKLELLKFQDDVTIHNLSDIIQAYFNDQKPTFTANTNYLVCHGKSNIGGTKNRSYIDLYSICLYYFPQMSFSDLYEFLRNTNYYWRTYRYIDSSWNTWFKCNNIDRQVLSGSTIIKTEGNELLAESKKLKQTSDLILYKLQYPDAQTQLIRNEKGDITGLSVNMEVKM